MAALIITSHSHTIVAVSYTHLDVYKRQGVGGWGLNVPVRIGGLWDTLAILLHWVYTSVWCY